MRIITIYVYGNDEQPVDLIIDGITYLIKAKWSFALNYIGPEDKVFVRSSLPVD